MRRLVILVIGLALWMGACGGLDAPPSPSARAAPSGILVVNIGEQVQAVPHGELLANAFNTAMELAQSNGDALGYPWIDPSSGELVASAVTQRGRELVEQVGLAVPYTVRMVAHGTTELVRVQDEATGLVGEGVPGAELIYKTMPDHRDNRTLLVIRASNAALLEALATRFPEGTVAVQVSPGP